MTLRERFGTLLSEADYRCIQYALNQPVLLPEAPPSLVSKMKALGISINRRVAYSEPPRGKRSTESVARLLAAYCEQLRQAQQNCPTDDDYQAAVQAENEAHTQWKFMQTGNRPDPHGLHSMATIRQKHLYEEAKNRRVEIGGAIIGAESMTHRMIALIGGELAAEIVDDKPKGIQDANAKTKLQTVQQTR